VSIKANKMALAAGVSALALMVMSSAVLAQEVNISEPMGCEPITEPMPTIDLTDPAPTIDPVVVEPEPTDPAVIIDPLPEVISIDEPMIDGDGYTAYGPEVTVVDEGEMVTIDEPVVVDGDEGTGDALLDIVPFDGQADTVDEGEVSTDVEPTGLHMLDDGIAVDVAVVEKSAGVALRGSAPALVRAAESAQDRVASASAIPNLCDTDAGQNNKFFCGSYNK
jgi:hypothetical protein